MDKNKEKQIVTSIISISIIAFFGIIIGINQYQKAKEFIYQEASTAFRISIKDMIKMKTANILYISSGYTYDPKKHKLGEYRTASIILEDTTITYQSKIVDRETEFYRSAESTLLDVKQLFPDTIQLIFDSLLLQKNIRAEQSIGIKASYYTKLNVWSKDTTQMSINYRDSIVGRGDFEDLKYYAYMHIPFSTVWKLMDKTAIYILLLVNGLLVALLVQQVRKKRKKEKEDQTNLQQLETIHKTHGIEKVDENKYRIGNVLFDPESKSLLSKEGEEERIVRLGKQQTELLLMFLQQENFKVLKEDIKERFWPKNSNPINNMTSCVDNLKKKLSETKCSYYIPPSSHLDVCYQLIELELETEKDNEEPLVG